MAKIKKSFVSSQISLMMILVLVKIIGFIKQIILAAVFGTSFEVDVYYLSSGFVGGIAQMLFGAISVAMLPIYTEYLVNEGRTSASRYVSKVLKFALSLAIMMAVFILSFANVISPLIAPSYSEGQLTIVNRDIRIFTLAVFFYCLSNIFSIVLDVEKIFIPYRISGIINSISFIGAALLLENTLGDKALIVAALVSWGFQLLNVYLAARKHFSYTNEGSALSLFYDEDIHSLVKLFIPMLIGNAIVEINDLVDKTISTGLATGSLSALSYSQILKEFVVFIFVTSLGGILFSYISSYIAQKREEMVSNFLNKTITILIMVLVPVSIYVFLYAHDIVRVAYMRGNFDMQAVELCASALKGYAIGFCFIAIRECMNKTHYAYQDTKQPMINGAIAVCGNIVFSILLSRKLGIAGVTVSTSISAFISSCLSVYTVKKHNKNISVWQGKKAFVQIVLAAIIVVLLQFILLNRLEPGMLRMILGVALVFIPYLVILVIFRNEDIFYLKNMLIGRVKKQ